MFFLLFIAITYYKILQIICILQPFNDHIPYFDLFSQPPFWRQIPQCYHSFLLLVHHDFYRTIILRHQLRHEFPACSTGRNCLAFPVHCNDTPDRVLPRRSANRNRPRKHGRYQCRRRHKFCRKPTLPLTHRLFFIGTIIAYLLLLDCSKP